MTMTTTIPIPAALLDSPLFGAHQDLQLLHETHGGLPLPLKTEAVFEVLAFRTAIKAGEPGLSSLVEKWAAAVLPQKHRSPVTSPKRTAVPLPNLSPSAPRTGERAPDPRPALGFAPIQCVPEYEPESENHSLFPAVPGSEARFVPVQLNPECDAGRNSSSRAAVSLPVSPGIAEVALPATASAPVTPPSPKKATGYFPLQGVKRSSPLASPPLSCAEAELAPTTQALSGLGLNPAGLAGLALGGDARTDALVNAHLNPGREIAGIELLPVLVNGAAPHGVPALSTPKTIATLAPAAQAAWTTYYLGSPVDGAAATKALRVCVGLPPVAP